MTRFFGILFAVMVILLAMGFAAANAGHRATLELGLFTLYRVPVTLVAFSGLFVGMLVMFATGIHTDLKVRRILRDRLAQEAEREQTWTDRHQRDLFSDPVEEERAPPPTEGADTNLLRGTPVEAAPGTPVEAAPRTPVEAAPRPPVQPEEPLEPSRLGEEEPVSSSEPQVDPSPPVQPEDHRSQPD